MANTVPCQHPNEHGVRTHIVGTKAAESCTGAKRTNNLNPFSNKGINALGLNTSGGVPSMARREVSSDDEPIDSIIFPGKPNATISQVHMDAVRMGSKMYGIMSEEGVDSYNTVHLSSLLMNVYLSGSVGDRPAAKYVIDNAVTKMETIRSMLICIPD